MPSAGDACSVAATAHHEVRGKARDGRPGSQEPTPDGPSLTALAERGAVSRRLVSLLIGSVLLLLLPVAAARAATVTIRVEGMHAPLVAPASITTTPGTFTKSATNAQVATCSQTSIGGALQQVTGGSWNGANSGFGISVDTILGETHLFASDAFWSLYVNDAPASNGACAQELAAGDRVLIAPACTGGDTPTCFSGDPLELTGPATVRPGATFTLHADEATVTTDPVTFASTAALAASAGAAVSGAGQTATTDAAGNVTLTAPAAGPNLFTVTKGDRVRGSAVVCATTGDDGACGTAKAPACATNGADGKCGTTDRTAPFPRLRGLQDGQHFKRGRGPRTLRGSVPGEAAVKDVRLRLTRTDGTHCSYYDATKERFVATRRCGAASGRSFEARSATGFSYLLPAALERGRYVLDVFVYDAAGNRNVLTRGESRVVFRVG
jgi:hypothetical protein